jgi:excisionase family DNA binding protein
MDWHEKQSIGPTSPEFPRIRALMRIPEAAERYGLSVTTVGRMIRRGDLPALRTGRSNRSTWLIPVKRADSAMGLSSSTSEDPAPYRSRSPEIVPASGDDLDQHPLEDLLWKLDVVAAELECQEGRNPRVARVREDLLGVVSGLEGVLSAERERGQAQEPEQEETEVRP